MHTAPRLPLPLSLRWLRLILFAALWLPVCLDTAAAAPNVHITPAPEWVTRIDAPAPPKIGTGTQLPGEHFLLVDRQINALSDHAVFSHYAVQLTNEDAIEENSTLFFEFDPTFQKLSLHSIAVWRDGKRLEKLHANDIELLQREKQLERLIYDGRWTASIILKDIRKGDVLDYSFSIEGSNPALDSHFSHQFQTEWATPVLLQHFRLLWPRERPLHIAPVKTDTALKQLEHTSFTEYVLSVENAQAFLVDSETPDWFQPWARVNFSDVGSWSEVVRWAMPKYQIKSPLGAELTSLISAIRTNNNTPKEQVAAALEFVQNEVRYQGIEIGTSGFLPHAPATTLARRFGDCKDKTTLLIAILRELGITADPALVDTYFGKTLDMDGPRIDAFNHVIARVTLDGRAYWLDPTMKNQYGGLDAIYQPNYGLALVLTEESNDLTSMDQDLEGHGRRIREEFDLRGGTKDMPRYRVHSTLFGADAQRFRSNLNTTGQTQLE